MMVNINKKPLNSEQQTLILTKRTSESLMATTAANDEQIRRRSSLSTELTTSDRSSRKGFNTMNSSTATTINSNKDLCTNSNTQINKSIVTYSTNGNSNEKVVIIDTTAVSLKCQFLFGLRFVFVSFLTLININSFAKAWLLIFTEFFSEKVGVYP
jgi:hypothetical protein